MSKVVRSIGNAISSVGKGIVNAVKGVVKAVGKVVSAVINFVTQPFMGLLGNMGGIPDSASEADRQQGVLISAPAGGDMSIPVIYGLRQVGGKSIFFETGSTNNQYLWVCYVLSEGPVEGIYDIAIDDEDVTTPGLISRLNAGEIVAVDKSGSRYTTRTTFQFWRGTLVGSNQKTEIPTAVADHLMIQAPSWKRTNILNGVACIFAKYEWKQINTQADSDNNPFGGNIPQLKVTVLGRRVASLLTTSNQSTVNYGDFSNGYIERYSTNPAECLLDYLRNPYYGKGLSNDEIDWDSFQKAAGKFNQTVTYVTGVTGPILTCNCVLDTGSTIMSNVKTMLQGCRSYLPYLKGKYKLKVEDAGNPTDILSGVATVVQVFDKDSIVGDINYQGIDRSAKYTAVEVTYVSPADKWANQTITYPVTEAERIAYRNQDGGRENSGSFTFPTIINYAMAYDMARLIFNKSRVQQSLSFKAPLQAMELEPGDNININSTLIDFYDEEDPGNSVPWRVISLRLGGDYTYDVDCVRNPDYIYPHARAGERDIVIPPYIPRGASIYYPGAITDIGLVPPGTSHWQEGQQPGDEDQGGFPNPEPTDPTDSNEGGGVGDPGYPGAPPAPPVVPSPPPYTDYIQIDRVEYTVINNLVTATITFRQPNNPNYAGVDFWFKRNISTETTYGTDSSRTAPGANGIITHSVRNLIKSNIPYILISRVSYGNNNSSTIVTRTELNVSGAVSTENPEDFEETAGAGWTLPTQPEPNPGDVIFSQLSAVPNLGSPPDDIRRLEFTMTQDINNPSGFQRGVGGVMIYYKLSSDTYWKTSRSNFGGGYFPGQPITFTPNLDLGIGNPSPDDASDNFDFIFRLTYNNENPIRESSNQWRYMGVDVSNLTSANPFESVTKIYEDSSEYNFITEENAPPGEVVGTRNITFGVASIGWVNQTGYPGVLVFNINPPAVADRVNWYGVKIRYRLIPPGGGAASNFDELQISKSDMQVDAGVWQLRLPLTPFNDYQIILTPEVRYAGSRTESYQSWYGQGKFDTSYIGNMQNLFQFNLIDTAQISEIQNTPFPQVDPIVVIRPNWVKKITSGSGSYTALFKYYEVEYNASHISGLTGVRVYRRANSGLDRDGTQQARHYGLGRWEYIDIVPGTNAEILPNGNVLVNLRFPISITEFSSNYTTANIGRPGFALESAIPPWTTSKIVQEEAHDIIFVASTSSGQSSRAIKIPVIVGAATTTTNLPTEVTVAQYNNYTAGFKRNITPGSDGSRVNVTSNLRVTATQNYTAPTQQRGSAVI